MDEQDSTEIRMRRALGLGSGTGANTPQQRPEQARARHKFVQDGGVPVVMLGQKAEPEVAQLRERIAVLEGQLEHERAMHAGTQRQLKESEAHRTALETRLAHADLTHRDAVEQERRLRLAAQEALQEAREAAAAPRRRVPAARTVGTEAVPAGGGPTPGEDGAEVVADPMSGAALEMPVVKRGRGRPRSTKLPEPKPVRWWTPGFRKGKA